MAYIGKTPVIGNFQVCDAISVVNNQAAYTMQVGSVNVIPQSANHMIVSLNGTIQKPNSSFTVSGAVITFSSNLVTNDVIDFIQILGSVLDLGVPSDATVTAAKIVDGAVNQAKIADEAINEAKLQISNAPTNGYMLTAQSGNTGGLTWVAAPTGFDPDAAVVFNESGNDADFRVEGSGNANMIKVDAGNDRVGIGRESPVGTLDVNGNGMVDATSSFYGNKFVVGAPSPNSTASGSGYGWGMHSSGAMYWNFHDGNAGYWNNNNSSNTAYINFRTKGNHIGSILFQQSSTVFNTSSDYRLKENVTYDWDATSRLKQLKPARFNFIIDDTNTLVDGFIAHEVSSIVPEAIAGEKDALEEDGSIKPQGIDQSKLVPLLVKTIQELEARITALENA